MPQSTDHSATDGTPAPPGPQEAQPGSEAPPRPAPSLRKGFSWAFAGNMVFFVSQWAMGVILAKFGSPELVGEWTYAQAICIPIYIFSMLQLRAVLVSDSRDEYAFGHYFTLRVCTSIIATVICTVWAFVADAEPGVKWLIVAMAINQGTFTVRDIIINMSVKQERMNLYALSQFLQGGMSVVLFGAAFLLTRQLLLAVALMVLGRVLVTVLYDGLVCRRVMHHKSPAEARFWRPEWRKLLHLAWVAAPLGLIMGLISWRTQIPRLVLEEYYDKEALGYYGAVAMLLVALNMIYNSSGQTAGPRLAKYYAAGRSRAYKVLVAKLVAVCALAGLAGVLGAWLLGETVLRIVFTPEYAEYKWLLILMMVVGTLYGINNAVGYGVTATRTFRAQLWPNVVATGAALGCSYWLIPPFGIAGAVYALMIAVGCSTLGLLVVFWYRMKTVFGKGFSEHG